MFGLEQDEKRVLKIAEEISEIINREIKRDTSPLTVCVGVMVALDTLLTTLDQVPVIGGVFRDYVTGFFNFRHKGEGADIVGYADKNGVEVPDSIRKSIGSSRKTTNVDEKDIDKYF